MTVETQRLVTSVAILVSRYSILSLTASSFAMADYIINEITSVRTFVAARERVASPSATGSLQRDLALALLQHIQAAPKLDHSGIAVLRTDPCMT